MFGIMASKYSYAIVCSSNQNRSMEGHCFLMKKGFNVKSYGTGTHVKLPGPSAEHPNVYEFGVPYDKMYRDLDAQNQDLYTHNGVLMMLDRNRKTKDHPERFQESMNVEAFDVIVSCEERVFDQILQAFEEYEGGMETVHIVNLDIKDNHVDATIGSFAMNDLCQMIEKSEDLDEDIEDIIQRFQEKSKLRVLHSVQFY
eukprot:CFRG0759T1